MNRARQTAVDNWLIFKRHYGTGFLKSVSSVPHFIRFAKITKMKVSE